MYVLSQLTKIIITIEPYEPCFGKIDRIDGTATTTALQKSNGERYFLYFEVLEDCEENTSIVTHESAVIHG